MFKSAKATKGAAPVSPELRKARVADSIAFGVQAILLVSLLTSLPSLSPILGITEKQIAWIVLALSAVAAVGSIFITWVAAKTNSAFAIRLSLGLIVISSFALTFGPMAPESSRIAVFVCCVMLYGFAVGTLDATTNMQAVAIQRRYGKIILNSFHASWSVGAILGAGVVSLGQTIAIQLGYGEPKDRSLPDPYLYDRYMWTMVAVIILLSIVIILISPHMLKYGAEEDQAPTKEEAKKFNPPMRTFAALCAAMVFFYTIDFALENWSPLYLEGVFNAGKDVAPLGVGAYMVLGMFARLIADPLARRFGESRTLFMASVISAIGMAIALFAPSTIVAIIGFAIVGCGVPITAPLCFSTVGHLVPMDQLDTAVGRLNLFNYLGTITGGGVVGLIAGSLGTMKAALVIQLVMCVLLIVVAPFFRRPKGFSVPGSLDPSLSEADRKEAGLI